MRCVLDANVIVKWMLHDAETEPHTVELMRRTCVKRPAANDTAIRKAREFGRA